MTTAELLDALDASVDAVRAKIDRLNADLDLARRRSNGQKAESIGPFTPFSVRDAETPPRTVHWTFSVANIDVTTPQKLRMQMELAGLTSTAFASVFDVPAQAVQDWLSGARPIPSWVLPALLIFQQLSSAVRRKLLASPGARRAQKSVNAHPFSRIEDL